MLQACRIGLGHWNGAPGARSPVQNCASLLCTTFVALESFPLGFSFFFRKLIVSVSLDCLDYSIM